MTPRRIACLALSGLILGSAAQLVADGPPPKKLYLVGDHWTAWEPPTSFPEGTEIYTIERGDTLWDLANRFYGNPYLWPQLWERNQYILDAHWIYPGDPLVVGVEVTPLAEMVEGVEGIGEAEAEEGVGLDRRVAAPVALGSEDDIYCTGYIGALRERFPYLVTGSENQSLGPGGKVSMAKSSRYGEVGTSKLGLTASDIVYVDGGRAAGMTAGEVHTIIGPEEEVRHPLTDNVVGRFYRYHGRLQILSVQESSGIAEIVHACHPVNVGDSLRPFEPEPVPLARRSGMRGINDPVNPQELRNAPAIIYSDAGLVTLGQGHVAFIDLDARDDVAPGDIYSVYRETRPGQPPLLVGELAVLSVGPEASLAKVLESRYAVRVGDRLHPKFR